jgi:hypothetical protein
MYHEVIMFVNVDTNTLARMQSENEYQEVCSYISHFMMKWGKHSLKMNIKILGGLFFN